MPTSADHRARTERYNTTALILLIGLVVQALITIYTNPDRSLIEGAPDNEMSTIILEEEEAITSSVSQQDLSASRPHADNLRYRSQQREDPSTIQNKFLVGYQGWSVRHSGL
jgi:hypothetical protein